LFLVWYDFSDLAILSLFTQELAVLATSNHGMGRDAGGGAGHCQFRESGVITLCCVSECFRVCAERFCFATGLAMGPSAIADEDIAADGFFWWALCFCLG
jgi:hypothetical protein